MNEWSSNVYALTLVSLIRISSFITNFWDKKLIFTLLLISVFSMQFSYNLSRYICIIILFDCIALLRSQLKVINAAVTRSSLFLPCLYSFLTLSNSLIYALFSDNYNTWHHLKRWTSYSCSYMTRNNFWRHWMINNLWRYLMRINLQNFSDSYSSWYTW